MHRRIRALGDCALTEGMRSSSGTWVVGERENGKELREEQNRHRGLEKERDRIIPSASVPFELSKRRGTIPSQHPLPGLGRLSRKGETCASLALFNSPEQEELRE